MTSIQSVDRAIAVLEFLSTNGWSGVTEVAAALGTHKSTAYRLLSTLKDRGLVEQDAATDRYRLGLGLVYLASAVSNELDILHYARPVCDRLRERTQGTVTISVLTGDDVMVIYQAMSSSSVLSVDWRGKHLPLHCTSDGKILLAHLPENRRRALLSKPLRRFTAHTIVDPDILREQLRKIRETGYGFTLEELEIGLNAVAAPVYSGSAGVVATVGLSGTSARFPPESIPQLAQLVIDAAGEITTATRSAPAPSGTDPGLRTIPV
jgi:DNA-binding IclR family transcriptional regulator